MATRKVDLVNDRTKVTEISSFGEKEQLAPSGDLPEWKSWQHSDLLVHQWLISSKKTSLPGYDKCRLSCVARFSERVALCQYISLLSNSLKVLSLQWTLYQ